MKPHPLRKTLSLANLVLSIAVVGVAGWFFTRVRPAVAQVMNQPKSYQPAEYAKLQQSYEGQRREGLAWQPDVPVSGADIHTWILRADYARKDPPHWIFSGPMPPTKEAAPARVAAASEPQGLESLGQVALVVYGTDESSLILFSFGSAGKSGVFRIGEWVRVDRGAERIYRLTRISAGPQRRYKIHYAVYGQDKQRPERTGVLEYESGAEVAWPPYLTLFSPGGPPRASPRPAGTRAGGAEPAQPDQAPSSEGPASSEEVAQAEAGTVHELRGGSLAEDLKPVVELVPGKRNERVVRFDQNSFDFFRGPKAKHVARSIKTEVVVDRETKRPIGLRITGLKRSSAAAALQVKQGDILVSINGHKISGRADVVRLVEQLKGAQVVTIVLERHGRQLTYHVDPSDPKKRRQIGVFENLK